MASSSSSSGEVSPFNIFVKRLIDITPRGEIITDLNNVNPLIKIEQMYKNQKKTYNTRDCNMILSDLTNRDISGIASILIDTYHFQLSACGNLRNNYLSKKLKWSKSPLKLSDKADLLVQIMSLELSILIFALDIFLSACYIGIIVSELERRKITNLQLYKDKPKNDISFLPSFFMAANSDVRYMVMYALVFDKVYKMFFKTESSEMSINSEMNCSKDQIINSIRSIFKTKLSHVFQPLTKIAERAHELHKYLNGTCNEFNYRYLPDLLDIDSIDISKFNEIPHVINNNTIFITSNTSKIIKNFTKLPGSIGAHIKEFMKLFNEVHTNIVPSNLKTAKDRSGTIKELLNTILKHFEASAKFTTHTTSNVNDNVIAAELLDYFKKSLANLTHDYLQTQYYKKQWDNAKGIGFTCAKTRYDLSCGTISATFKYTQSLISAFVGDMFLRNATKFAVTKLPLERITCEALEQRHIDWITKHSKHNEWLENATKLVEISTLLLNMSLNVPFYTREESSELLSFSTDMEGNQSDDDKGSSDKETVKTKINNVKDDATEEIIKLFKNYNPDTDCGNLEKILKDTIINTIETSKSIKSIVTFRSDSVLNSSKSSPIILRKLTIEKIKNDVGKKAKKEVKKQSVSVSSPPMLIQSPVPTAEEIRIWQEEKLQDKINEKIRVQEELNIQLKQKEEYELHHRLEIHCSSQCCSESTPRFLDTDAFTMVQCTKDCIIRYHDNCFKTYLKLECKLEVSQLKRVTKGSLPCVNKDKCTGTINMITHMNNHEEIHRVMVDLPAVVYNNNSSSSSSSSSKVGYDYNIDAEVLDDKDVIIDIKTYNKKCKEECKIESIKPVILKDISELRQISRVNNSNNSDSVSTSSSCSSVHKISMSGQKKKKKVLHLDEFCSLAAINQISENSEIKAVPKELYKQILQPVKKKHMMLNDIVVTDIPSQYVVLCDELEGVNEKNTIRKFIKLGAKVYEMSKYADLKMVAIFEFTDVKTALAAISQVKDVPFGYINLPSDTTFTQIMHRSYSGTNA